MIFNEREIRPVTSEHQFSDHHEPKLQPEAQWAEAPHKWLFTLMPSLWT